MSGKFVDGMPVPLGYQTAVTKALNDCCDARPMCPGCTRKMKGDWS